VGPQTGISKDVPQGDIMMSIFPAKPRREWWKFVAHVERLAAAAQKNKGAAK
jgi:UDP-3-O-[3-hydroxymyristoyl] glucosamine N-acyltransferase